MAAPTRAATLYPPLLRERWKLALPRAAQQREELPATHAHRCSCAPTADQILQSARPPDVARPLRGLRLGVHATAFATRRFSSSTNAHDAACTNSHSPQWPLQFSHDRRRTHACALRLQGARVNFRRAGPQRREYARQWPPLRFVPRQRRQIQNCKRWCWRGIGKRRRAGLGGAKQRTIALVRDATPAGVFRRPQCARSRTHSDRTSPCRPAQILIHTN